MKSPKSEGREFSRPHNHRRIGKNQGVTQRYASPSDTLFRPGPSGGMADATDSKSVVRKDVWVRLPPRAPGDQYTFSHGSATS